MKTNDDIDERLINILRIKLVKLVIMRLFNIVQPTERQLDRDAILSTTVIKGATPVIEIPFACNKTIATNRSNVILLKLEMA